MTLLQAAGEWGESVSGESLSYETRRTLEARAQVLRILRETGIDDRGFFAGRIVAEIGPGPVGFLEQSGARLGIAIEPLAREYQEKHLILPWSNTVYLPVAVESIPVLDDFVDIVVSRYNLDHVDDPRLAVREIQRILAPGGYFLLIVDIDHQATITEPQALSRGGVRALVADFETVREMEHEKTDMSASRRFAGVYRKRHERVARGV